ncbi:alkylated DNA repair protein alkB-like [Heracleum sosnowskyi]|uniref:Alkylated DNA repair protein alkB-like n=1 Tax=Heracleum sosnowskyi TaxID=360622 RepID=A0AAD8MHT1_9APIA|nr:alkylated DNA repair protein alkB-like [Heracleum sosnowskyi]
MGLPRFAKTNESSSNLYVANCGPAVGLDLDIVKSAFSKFGVVSGVYSADESGTRVIVSFVDNSCARAAFEALDRRACEELGGRVLHIKYSVFQPPLDKVQVNDSVPVCLETSDMNIPGICLIHDFITIEEEKELLAAVDSRPWKSLAKRRVQHYGYEFCYSTRNVNTNQHLGELPSFLSPVLDRISSFEELSNTLETSLDQLTVNEYPPGVGLSPHIDTHSAFEGSIFSLSLAGPCIMEFRKYTDIDWISKSTSLDKEVENSDSSSSFLRRAIYLPPRSILLLSGEARYAWHHYIPHHKVDLVNDSVIRRASRRVSFTIRKVRKGPCLCQYPQYCDSRK